MDALIKYWPMAIFLTSTLSGWWCWSMRQMAKNEIAAAVGKLQAKDEAICEAVDELDTRATKLEGRVEGIEHDIANLPTKADIERVEGRINTVGQDAGAAARGVERLEHFFLTRGVESVR